MSVREAEARALAEAVEGVVGRRRLGLRFGGGDVGGHNNEDEEGKILHVLAASLHSLKQRGENGTPNECCCYERPMGKQQTFLTAI